MEMDYLIAPVVSDCSFIKQKQEYPAGFSGFGKR